MIANLGINVCSESGQDKRKKKQKKTINQVSNIKDTPLSDRNFNSDKIRT